MCDDKLQLEKPTRGDWASECFQDLKDFKIEESLEQIQKMTKYKFTQLLRQRTRNRALSYLTEKQRIKGKEIEYKRIEMSYYLTPCNKELSIDEKRKLFAVRNKMINLKENFSKSKLKDNCICGQIESLRWSGVGWTQSILDVSSGPFS